MPDQHVEGRACLFNVTDCNQLEEGIMRDPGAMSVIGEKTKRMIADELLGPKIPRRSATLQFGTLGSTTGTHRLGRFQVAPMASGPQPIISSGELTDRGNIDTSNRRV